MHFRWRLGLVLLTFGSAACDESRATTGAVFAEPVALAVARGRIFVANAGEDTVQVLELGDTLADLDFLYAPAQLFPLRIPAGPAPQALAATADGGYVVVANTVAESLRLIDAESLLLAREADGSVHTLSLGATPIGLVAGASCTSPCAGLVYTILAGLGAVAEIAVSDDAGGRLELRRVLAVGGAPTQLAITQDGRTLFLVDGSDVLRVDVASAALDRRAIGGSGGAIAVSTDGSIVIVGRPDSRDVVLLSAADSSAFAVLDADPVFAPTPACLEACSTPAVCLGAHPADTSMCLADGGLQATVDYTAIYLGAVPRLIVPLGQAAGHPEILGPSCTPPLATAASRQTFSEAAAIVTLDGRVAFLGLRDATGSLTPELLNFEWCESPRMQNQDSEQLASPENVLAPCPPMPDRNRYVCACQLEEDDDPSTCTSGVLGIMPGSVGSASLTFDWEGTLLSRVSGGGEITSDGNLRDVSVDLAAQDIRSGDVLEILTEALFGDACEVLATDAACTLERRIEAVDAAGSLTLDVPLDPDCFRSGGAVAYRVRAGSQYLVTLGAVTERVAPGAGYGPGSQVAVTSPVLFQTLALDPLDDLDACARYASGGLSAPLVRDTPITFFIDDAFSLVRSGYFVEGKQLRTDVPAGRLPSAAVVSATGAASPVVFVSYAGSGADGVLGFVPFDVDRMFVVGETYRIIR